MPDYNTELKLTAECSDPEKTNALADESIIPVGGEHFRYVEVLSWASFNANMASGIHDTSFRCLMKCDVDIHKKLYADVVLSGGTTILQGIGEHKTNELTEKTYVLPDENIVTVGTPVPSRGNVVPASLTGLLVPRHLISESSCSATSISAKSLTQCRGVKRHDLFQHFFFNTTKELTASSHPR